MVDIIKINTMKNLGIVINNYYNSTNIMTICDICNVKYYLYNSTIDTNKKKDMININDNGYCEPMNTNGNIAELFVAINKYTSIILFSLHRLLLQKS